MTLGGTAPGGGPNGGRGTLLDDDVAVVAAPSNLSAGAVPPFSVCSDIPGGGGAAGGRGAPGVVAFLTPLRSEARRASNHARAALRGIAPCPRARGAPGGRGIVLAGKRISLMRCLRGGGCIGGSGDDDEDVVDAWKITSVTFPG